MLRKKRTGTEKEEDEQPNKEEEVSSIMVIPQIKEKEGYVDHTYAEKEKKQGKKQNRSKRWMKKTS